MLAFFQAGFIEVVHVGLVARQRIYLRQGSTHDAGTGHDNFSFVHIAPPYFCPQAGFSFFKYSKSENTGTPS